MARDLTTTIRFVGDASQLIATYGLIGRSSQQLAREINTVARNDLAAQFKAAGAKLSPFPQGKNQLYKLDSRGQRVLDDRGNPIKTGTKYDTRPYIKGPPTTEFDTFNKTLRTTYDLYVRAADGSEQFHSQVRLSHGDTDAILDAERGLAQTRANAIPQLQAIRKELNATRQAYRDIAREKIDPAQQALGIAKSRVAAAQQVIPLQTDAVNEARRARYAQQKIVDQLRAGTFKTDEGRVLSGAARSSALIKAEAELESLKKVLSERRAVLRQDITQVKQLQAESNAALGQLLAAQTDAEVQAALSQLRAIEARRNTALATLNTNQEKLAKARQAASEAPSPTPGIVRALPPRVQQRVARLGINLNDQEIARNFQLTRDLEHNITRLTGSFHDAAGVSNLVNIAWDKQGTIIGRLGGHLSGLQNALRQVVNNFTKVVYWTAATSLVIGGLGVVSGAASGIIELDKTLQRLSITAQLTSSQTKGLFNDLAQIAYDTATPLNEMVSAADDIALATRKAGQTTEEWKAQILNLSQAVGILTNLTGIDTVQATDLLTSTMKQLNLEGTDLISILNKVTAVAGGQSVAIGDIITGLGNMAEAAQQAGLTIDETIATVQVLSQVTAKSSKEVATAFKNLTGSLDSPGATKVLEKYNISLKDEQGNLKNILQVYKEVNQAIQEGRIKASDVKATVKALAGGPRRAPDAAALLGAVSQIDQVTQKSIHATNEALLANAKVLDTVQAKITQLGVTFQKFTFGSFGQAFKDAAGTVIDALELIIKLLSQIPTGVLATVIKLGVLLSIVKLLAIGGRFLVGAFGEFAAGLKFVAAQAGVATVAINEETAALQANALAAKGATAANLGAARTGPGTVIPLGPGPGQPANAAKFALTGLKGGLIGAGVGAAAGLGAGALGIPKDIGQPLQLLGSAIATVGLAAPALAVALGPVTIGVAALGFAALAAGVAIDAFGSKTEDVAEKTAHSNEAILQSAVAYQEAQANVAGLKTVQADALRTYSALTKTEKDRRDNADIINATLQRYGETTHSLAEANNQLTASYDNLTAAIQGTKYTAEIAAANAGTLTGKTLAELRTKVADEILQAQKGINYRPLEEKVEPPKVLPFLSSGPIGARTADQTRTVSGGLGTSSTQTIVGQNLDESALKLGKVIDLFDQSGKVMTGTFNHTVQTVDLIRNSLQAAAEAESDVNGRAHNALATFNAIAAQTDALSNVNLFVDSEKALLQSRELLGEINHDTEQIGEKNLNLYKQLIELSAKLPHTPSAFDRGGREAPTPALDTGTQEGLQARAQQLLTQNITSGLSIGNAREILDIFLKAKVIAVDQKQLNDAQVAAFGTTLGLAINITGALKEQLTVQADIAAAEKAINDLRISNLDEYAAKSGQIQSDYLQTISDIQKQFKAGDINSGQRDKLIANAQATRKALNDSAIATKNLQNNIGALYKDLAGNQGALDNFNKRLSEIPGLQNLVGKSTGEAAKILDAYVGGLNLTSGAAAKLTKLLLLVKVAADALPKYKKIVLELQTVRTVITRRARGDAADYNQDVIDSRNLAKQAAAAKTAADKAGQIDINAIMRQINALLSSATSSTNFGGGFTSSPSSLGGSGGGSGSSGSTRTPPDVSTLDIPEEILKAYNPNSLIKEAIRRAKELQAKIPGASKEAKNDIVELLNGTKRVLEVRGVKEELLRRALEELAGIEKKRLEFETKADTIRRIRVGSGDFAAIANVPVNTKTGVSVGGSNNINVTLGVNGQILTPAQMAQLADLVAAAIKRQLGA